MFFVEKHITNYTTPRKSPMKMKHDTMFENKNIYRYSYKQPYA